MYIYTHYKMQRRTCRLLN